MPNFNKHFVQFSNFVAHASGKPLTFALAVLLIVVWGVTGPLFHYSDAWQLVINTGTTIVTFLMVFLIQNTQNRDGAAIQTKLDELTLRQYGALTDIDVQELVLDYKWHAAVSAKIDGEVNALTLALVARVRQLGERYDSTVAALDSELKAREAQVSAHLLEMGVGL